MIGESDCTHHWEIGLPRGEQREEGRFHITSGVCLHCGAERDFETNMDELDWESRKSINSKWAPKRQMPNEITKIWDSS